MLIHVRQGLTWKFHVKPCLNWLNMETGSFLERFWEIFKRLGGQLSFPENHLKRPDSHLLALVSYLQRLDSQFQPSAAIVLRQLIAVFKRCFLLPVERGQGRAAGAAEDHMTCLEVL